MTPTQVSSLGYDLAYEIPSSSDEYDQLAKEVGACVKSASLNVIYRSVLASFRDLFLHGAVATDGLKNADGSALTFDGLDKQTGIERNTKPGKPKKDGKPGEDVYDETEDEFAKRVWASLVSSGKAASIDAARAIYAPFAQQVLGYIVFDPTKQTREAAGPKKVPKTFVAVAQSIIDSGKADSAATKLAALVGHAVTPDLASLSQAVWEDQTNKREAMAAQYSS